MEFGISDWRTYEQGIQRGWLLTNGLGGYASSTLILSNTRRYHGLLIASLKPPGDRRLILSKIDESVEVNGRKYDLSSFSSGDFIMKGYEFLQKVTFRPLPCYYYSVAGVLVEKKICLVYGENTVAVVYKITNGNNSAAKFRMTPLLNFRDHHHNLRKNQMNFTRKAEYSSVGGKESRVEIAPFNLDTTIKLSCIGGFFLPAENCWFYNMRYYREEERGLDAYEDHYIPGSFDIIVEPGAEKQVAIVCTVEKEWGSYDAFSIVKKEEDRINSLHSMQRFQGDNFASVLAVAADKFIVHRQSTGKKTIIAGYPWFADWGRDTMISLCGLTLVTGRYKDAEEILVTFSKYIKHGLVPNMFPEGNDEPLYNSVDASLWYFEAIGKYLRYTGNYDFIKDSLYASMKDIIRNFKKGTINKIYVDRNGLVSAGDPGTQLTWMDAKVDSWVVTPRHGKAVEINALWYNALRIMEELESAFGNNPAEYAAEAEKVKKSFIESFWNEKKKCLYDVINDDGKDGSIRPNQVFAVSLLYPVLEGEKARYVVDKVWKELYTPFGLRTLSRSSPGYKGIYIGNQYQRDSAYHQGTVWPWLLGHFVTAFVRVYGKEGIYGRIVASFIEPFKDHLRDACISNISEIFDGDTPHWHRGCMAQAWSVAEVLRCYIEDVL